MKVFIFKKWKSYRTNNKILKETKLTHEISWVQNIILYYFDLTQCGKMKAQFNLIVH